MNAAPTPAEAERADYRARTIRSVAGSGVPLSDLAALAVDVLAAVPQAIMRDPLDRYARLHFEVHAEDQGAPIPSRLALADALAELTDRDLLPTWCSRLASQGGAR